MIATSKKTILITGGTGYIGSHVAVTLLEQGYDVIILDNLSNSAAHVVGRIGRIANKDAVFVEGDVRDSHCLSRIFADCPIHVVMHFAGLKSVADSVDSPLDYYDNNLNGTLCLLRAMQDSTVRNIIFSSSATVYGLTGETPYTEVATLNPANPYGQTKRMVEQVLTDLCSTGDGWRAAILRYFNPVGAHESGQIGEDPRSTPQNLMPYICQVAQRRLPFLSIFGDDYPTADGTGERDYVHVTDLALGHVAALKALASLPSAATAINLGAGRSVSVLELVRTFERVNAITVPCKIVARRRGDIASYYADVTKAQRLLNWQVMRSVEDMCRDAWRWQMNLSVNSKTKAT